MDTFGSVFGLPALCVCLCVTRNLRPCVCVHWWVRYAINHHKSHTQHHLLDSVKQEPKHLAVLQLTIGPKNNSIQPQNWEFNQSMLQITRAIHMADMEWCNTAPDRLKNGTMSQLFFFVLKWPTKKKRRIVPIGLNWRAQPPESNNHSIADTTVSQ